MRRFLPAVLVLLLIPLDFVGGMQLQNFRPITPDSMTFLAAVWSPDGKWLTLTSENYRGIWLIRPQGDGLRLLTDDCGSGFQMSWSPDARAIVYKAIREQDGEIYKAIKIVDTESGDIVALTGESQFMVGIPTWNTDNTIGFSFEGEYRIVSRYGEIRRVIEGIKANTVAADNAGRLAFADYQDRLWLVAHGTSALLTSRNRYFGPCFSANGRFLLAKRLGGDMEAFFLDTKTRIGLGAGSGYSWSPDGVEIVYEVTRDDGHDITASDLFMIDVNTAERTQLTFTTDLLEMHPYVAPDGKRLAYSELRTGKIWIADIVR